MGACEMPRLVRAIVVDRDIQAPARIDPVGVGELPAVWLPAIAVSVIDVIDQTGGLFLARGRSQVASCDPPQCVAGFNDDDPVCVE